MNQNENSNNNKDCICKILSCLVQVGPTGPTGATGPQGITGPTGPTGPAGEDGGSFNAAAMVHDESELVVPSHNVIKYNMTNLSNGITYDSNNGEFTLPQDGQYLVTWWVNARNNDKFSLFEKCKETALGIELHQYWPEDVLIAHSSTHNAVSCCETGTISGNAIFNAKAGSTYRFVNSSDVDFKLVPNDLYSASVSITRIN